MTKLEVIEKTEVIEEINLEDGADPGYQLDPGAASCLVRTHKLSAVMAGYLATLNVLSLRCTRETKLCKVCSSCTITDVSRVYFLLQRWQRSSLLEEEMRT